MKMRMIKLRPEFLIEKLQGKISSFTSNLPDDIELLDIKYDLFSKQVFAIIRSDSFEDVAESYPIPEFNVIYMTNPKTESQPTTNSKPRSKPTEKTLVQPSQDTSAVEKEFSSERERATKIGLDLQNICTDFNLPMVVVMHTLKESWDNNGGDVSLFQLSQEGVGIAEHINVYSPPPGFERNDLFLSEMRHFQSVVRGESAPACTLEDGIQALHLALAAICSAKQAEIIRLD